MIEKKNGTTQLTLTIQQVKDVGILVCLVLLIAFMYWKHQYLLIASISLLLINILYYKFFKPFASFWFKFSELLSNISSVIILSVLFFLMVTPMAILFKMLGRDKLRLKEFKHANNSVFKNNESGYEIDFETPF